MRRGISIPLRYGWPLDFLFFGFPVFWVLGLHSFAWQLMALPLAFRLVAQRHRLRVPKGFGLWLLFLAWNLLSVLMLQRSSQIVGFVYRYSLYLSATVIFLFAYNAPRHLLPVRRVYSMLAAMWVWVVLGGWLGVLMPHGQFTSVIELLLPHGLASNQFVHELTHPSFAQVQMFLGYPLGRPNAPFIYTNHWGAAFALLTPIVLLGWAPLNLHRYPLAGPLLLVASLVPAVVSLNRGLFLSLFVALVYASARSGRMGARARRALLGLLVVLVALLALTPLGSLVQQREANQHSNEGRAALYSQSVSYTLQSPLLGYGAPQEVQGDLLLPPVGTQGQFWLVMVSQGFVGLALYLGFLLSLFRSTRRLPPATAVANLLVVILLVQMFVYDLITAPHNIVFLVCAVALRDLHDGADPLDEAAPADTRAATPVAVS